MGHRKERKNGYAVKRSDYDSHGDYPLNESETENSPCPVTKRCGGCQWMGMDYQEQQIGRAHV